MRIPKKGIDSNQLKQFQNSIRELNRGGETLLWKDKGVKEPAWGVVKEQKKTIENLKGLSDKVVGAEGQHLTNGY